VAEEVLSATAPPPQKIRVIATAKRKTGHSNYE
jgi:hypothetical protein